MFDLMTGLLFSLFTFLLSIPIWLLYFGMFFERHKKIYLSYLIWVLYFLWHHWGNDKAFPFYVNVFVNIVFSILICHSTYKGKIFQKIVFSFLINAIWMQAEILTAYGFILCGIDYLIPKFWGILFSQTMILLIIILLRRFFRNENVRSLPVRYNMLFLLIPIGSMFIMYNIFMLSVESGGTGGVYESFASSVMILLMNLIIFKLYLAVSKEKELQKYNAVYEQQLELCNQHMIEKENLLTEFRNARHDMKHHVTVLMEMMSNAENTQAAEYLKRLINTDSIGKSGISKSDNIVIDSLVNAKYFLAIKKKIKFDADIHIPMQLPFQGADLSILIGNILDNAIEASEEIEEDERFIKLYMRYEKNVLIITVINAFSGEILRNREGKIMTKKKDSDMHGIGLESVRKVVEKYHGSFVIETGETESHLKEFKIKAILFDIP